MTVRPARPDPARVDRTSSTDQTRLDDLLPGLRLWHAAPPESAEVASLPTARRAARLRKSAGTRETPPALGVEALGIDPESCPRIGRDDDLTSRRPNAGMPRSAPELPEPLDPGTLDRQLIRVVEAWAELPARTRKTIVALVSVARQRKGLGIKD
jgi:hypothetical protein